MCCSSGVKPQYNQPTNLFYLFTKQQNFEMVKIKGICKLLNKASKMITFISDGVEYIVGKKENVGKQHYLIFLQCFPILLHKTYASGPL